MDWTTLIYYGHLLSKESVQRLKNSDMYNTSYLNDYADDEGRQFLCPPGSLVEINCRDSILEEKDESEGITLEQLKHAARNCPHLLDPVLEAKAREPNLIYMEMMGICYPDEIIKPGIHICEIVSRSYDKSRKITYNIPVGE